MMGRILIGLLTFGLVGGFFLGTATASGSWARATRSGRFLNIHDRAGKVLPVLIPKLRAEGYTFAGLDADGALVKAGRP